MSTVMGDETMGDETMGDETMGGQDRGQRTADSGMRIQAPPTCRAPCIVNVITLFSPRIASLVDSLASVVAAAIHGATQHVCYHSQIQPCEPAHGSR
jgi:hypothetical protein